jgi:murein DD-endopeptidase MepM/ murein hydrolase activator NlpD
MGGGGHTLACMSRITFVLLLAVALAVLDVAPVAARQRWRAPLPGAALRGAFTFDRAAPYARGGRRGVDLRGAPGARVVAACAGVVTYAGRVPGWGRGVSLRCGGLVATELGLASAAVGRGARVWPGAVVGRLASRGLLRLGARRVGDRQGYVDPLGLLGHGDRSAPPPVAPRGRPAVRPRAPAPAVTPVAPALPWLAVAGLGLLASGLGGGRAARRRSPGQRRTGMALAQR